MKTEDGMETAVTLPRPAPRRSFRKLLMAASVCIIVLPLLLSLSIVGCSNGQQADKAGNADKGQPAKGGQADRFARAEEREKPVIPEEQAVYDCLVEQLDGTLNGLLRKRGGEDEKDPKRAFRIEKWGPHLFKVAWPAAEAPHDITVFTSPDDERGTVSAIRLKFKLLFRELGRSEERDVVWIMDAKGKNIGQLPGGDEWTKPYLQYQRTSGKKPRQLGR